MAEAVMRETMHQAGSTSTQVQSAGIGAMVGQGASDEAEFLLKEKGIDISQHAARQLSQHLVNWAELILVMEKSHMNEIQHHYPTSRGKVFLLGHWSGTEIEDPYMQDTSAFEAALEKINKAVDEWRVKILGN